MQLRDDSAYVNRLHTRYRAALDYCSVVQVSGPALQVAAPGGVCNADQVHLLDLGPYVDDTTHWLPWLRTVLGVREEYYRASDHSLTTGFQGADRSNPAAAQGQCDRRAVREDRTLFQCRPRLPFG